MQEHHSLVHLTVASQRSKVNLETTSKGGKDEVEVWWLFAVLPEILLIFSPLTRYFYMSTSCFCLQIMPFASCFGQLPSLSLFCSLFFFLSNFKARNLFTAGLALLYVSNLTGVSSRLPSGSAAIRPIRVSNLPLP